MAVEAEKYSCYIGASQQRSSSISLKVDRHYVVIEDVNPPFEMRRVVIPLEEQEKMPK